MNIPNLNSKEIFAYPHNGKYLLYAPLADIVGFADELEILSMEEKLGKGEEDDTVNYILAESDRNIDRSGTWSQQTELTILLNQKCNFACSYCYSKEGRDQTEISLELVKKALNHFLNPERGKSLSVVFSGGGDPILSFDIFREAVIYTKHIANLRCLCVEIGIVTNGSTLKDEYITFIKQNHVNLVVSCDILRDVHNAQRSHYDIVAATIDRLCEQGINVGIRSTITPLNVERMKEMVEELHIRFPKVHEAAFEPVLNKDLFPTVLSLNDFYNNFIIHIFEAISYGNQLGITIGNTSINNIDTNKTRACLGKEVLTPHGQLTACSRISSPKEAHYKSFCYGNLSLADGFNVDYNRYKEIIAYNVDSYESCQSCLAKYHCSGGCLLARKSLPNEYFEAYCHFNRELVKKVILSKYDIQYDNE